MEGIDLPEFLNTEEKYNKLIHEVDTLHKFEEIFLKLLDDDTLDMSTILTLMKVIERDVILVNKLTKATTLMEMTESFIRYIMTKDSDSPKKNDENMQDEQSKKPKSLKKIAKDACRKPKKMKPDAKLQPEEGKWECDC